MGLRIKSGPKWEDDSLNEISLSALEREARKFYEKTRPWEKNYWKINQRKKRDWEEE
jgi:hypothetical protein